MKSFKRIFKFIGISAAAILSLILLLALFTQTAFFKERLRAIIASNVSKQINGSLHLGTITGNFLSGFEIDSTAIYDADSSIVTTGKVTCKYDLIPMLQRRLKIRQIIIEKPTLNFKRPVDGKWNIMKLLKTSADTTAGRSGWTLIFDSVELKNGMISVVDSLSLVAANHWNMPSNFFEYHNFSVNDLNIKLSLTIKDDQVRIRLTHFSCYSPQSHFELLNFRTDFTFGKEGISARNTVVQTGKSYIEFDAAMEGINIFERIDLNGMHHDSTRLQFKGKNIDLEELKSFIPQIAFLTGQVGIDLEAEGEFGNLMLNRLNLRTFGTVMNLTGGIRNLHSPKDLYLDLTIDKSIVNPANARTLLAGLDIPSLGDLPKNSFFARFRGKPVNFSAKAAMMSESQSIEVDGSLNLEQKPPVYDLKFKTQAFDLGRFLGNLKIKSTLNAHGSVAGSGFSLKDLSTESEITIDSSSVGKVPLDKMFLKSSASHYLINGTVSLISKGMNGTISYRTKLSDSGMQSVSGELDLKSFDIASIVGNPEYHSDINVFGKFSGSGNNIGNISADADLSLLPSSFRERNLEPGTVTLNLNQKNSQTKQLNLKSPLADISLGGKFELDRLVRTISDHAENLIETIHTHATPESTFLAGVKKEKPIRKIKIPVNEIDFTYTVKIKNLDPIASVAGGTPFNMRAELEGHFKEDRDNLTLTCDGKFEEFFIGTLKGGILLKNGTISLNLDSLCRTSALENLKGAFSVSIDSGLLNTKTLRDIRIEARYREMRSTLSMDGIFDSVYSWKILGNISVQPHTYAFDFDSLIISANNHAWRNDQDIQCRLNYDGLRVMRCVLKKENEYLYLTGALLPTGAFDAKCRLTDFEIAGLRSLTHRPEMLNPGQGFRGTLDLNIDLSGSMSTPIIDLRAGLRDVYYSQTRIGDITAAVGYADRKADIQAEVRTFTTDSIPKLTMAGTLPIDLSFVEVPDRFPEKNQLLAIKSNAFDLIVLDPLIRDVNNLSGFLRCDVKIEGTPRNPRYSGVITLEKTRFNFLPNNIVYTIDAVLKSHGDTISMERFIIKNQPVKKISGETDLTGSFSIRNFKVASFDLIAKGQLLLMSEASKRNIPNMYGILFTEISPEGLKLRGTPDRPHLSGKLFIKEANITFPPTKTLDAANSNLSLHYTVIDDTTQKIFRESSLSKFYSGAGSDQFEAARNRDVRESPLLDRLRYDLDIEIGGPTALTMVFTPTTGEELYAELNGKVSAINDQGTPNIYGSIEISPRSYYNFFKHFDATGKLKFVGPWENPELDIKATYEGYALISRETGTDIQDQNQPVLQASQPPTEQKVIVELKIAGTRFEPKLTISMKVQPKPGEEMIDWATRAKGGDVQSDAISFIITGKFRDQLTSKEQQNFTDLGSATGSSVASSLLSSIFSDVLKREFPSILRADVAYYGGSFQEGTSVNVRATAFKGYLRVGGRIFNDIGNTNVSYQLSLGDFFDYANIRNLYFEIQRKVEGDNPDDRKLTNEARIFYRFSF